jgi:hypothetical protein
MRSEFTLRNQLDEKLQAALFVGRRDDGIGAFDALFAVIHAEGCVLPGLEHEWPTGVDFHQPQILGELFSLENPRGEVFVQ